MTLEEKEAIIMNYIDIFKTITDISYIQSSTGLNNDEITALLLRLAEKGYITEKDGKWKITPQGEMAINSFRQSMLSICQQRDQIIRKFEDFENINIAFKELITKWQVKILNGVIVPNDHTDKVYDSEILNKIFSIHEKVSVILGEISKIFPFLKRYGERLNTAIEKVKNNEIGYLIRERDSYHNIWFELHESILKIWGKESLGR